nr:HAMP domain-containing histidine kinase [Clostridia bacterium]
MFIILVSFTILAAIICTMVSDYSTESRAEIVRHTANAARLYMNVEYNNSDSETLGTMINVTRPQTESYITMLADYSGDLMIFITDTEGNILLSDSDTGKDGLTGSIPKAVIDEVLLSNGSERFDTLEGVLPSKHLIFALPINDAAAGNGTAVGAVFAASSSESVAALLETMLKTVIMATLWVLLAALVAVYFISERISGPLKEMTRAARGFAKGHFDMRIPVTGNDEVAELSVAFNNMAGSLANLEDMRRTFLANVSHDLRTPMTTISGFVDNIIDGIIPPEKEKYYLGIISGEVKRLSRLVSSLLDISRIQAGDRKFHKAPFDICEMARQILISFEAKIDEKRLDVEFECDEDKMLAFADRDAIHQILYNICDNGIKFSREGGKYRVTITSADQPKGKLKVSVFNEGQGIAPADLPYIFERFYKSDKSRGLDKTGVGLGMYISRTIIDAHDERIWVESDYGENCEFSFTLSRTDEKAAK